MKILKQLLVLLIIIALPVWLWIKYDNRDFLRYGALHIAKTPTSLNLLDYDSWGASDFRAEYYFSIDSSEFNKLLTGKRYSVKDCANNSFNSWAVNPKHENFKIKYCYTSLPTICNGAVKLYTNKEKTLVYVVYDVD